MHRFEYRDGYLYCEGVRVEDVARKVGTPFYLYSAGTIADHFLKLKKAFRPLSPLICYSMKANSSLAVCRLLLGLGAGLDIVSGGELYRAQRCGASSDKIVYASVGKTREEIARAIKAGILFFNVESVPELELINEVACRFAAKVKVAVRINPDIEPRTHRYITTGKLTNKFGIDLETAEFIFSMAGDFLHLDICGLHIHIGSQIVSSAPYVAAIKKVLSFVRRLQKKGVVLRYLNIGGGLGIIYDKETPQTAAGFAEKIIPLLRPSGLKIIIEPGRFIVGNAGILVSKVLFVKKTPLKNFIIVDAAMNDLLRPSLYGAYHNIIPLRHTRAAHGSEQRPRRATRYDIVGPICESGDFLAQDRIMPRVRPGDYLAVMSCGAYARTMSSNYNSRPRPPEVMAEGNRFWIARRRETYVDLLRNER
ncbi:MAG: diaminopimelate decarboxylase [Candidatus Omnitrophota bacterium]